MRVGLDIGSTTIKCVVLDEQDTLLYSTYERHYSHILEKAQELLLFYAGMSEGAEITASALQSETSLTLTGSQTYKNALLLKRLILRNRRLNLIVVNWKRIKLLAELSKC